MRILQLLAGFLAGTALFCQVQEAPAQPAPTMEERWGVRLESVRLTAANYMVDLRLRVIDTQKARTLFLRQVKPYLIDQASGAKLEVPRPAKVGPLRSSYEPELNRVYTFIFGNPGTFVKSGAKVTLVIGDFRAENLILE